MYSDANVRAPYVWWSGAISNPNQARSKEATDNVPQTRLSLSLIYARNYDAQFVCLL